MMGGRGLRGGTYGEKPFGLRVVEPNVECLLGLEERVHRGVHVAHNVMVEHKHGRYGVRLDLQSLCQATHVEEQINQLREREEGSREERR